MPKDKGGYKTSHKKGTSAGGRKAPGRKTQLPQKM